MIDSRIEKDVHKASRACSDVGDPSSFQRQVARERAEDVGKEIRRAVVAGIVLIRGPLLAEVSYRPFGLSLVSVHFHCDFDKYSLR
ncbi:MAG: hypothetical protein DMF89_22965 [Acidobacteria bacterium]|nr:MAG: hypothetical protein DMF89_22965 [Acidobacteriota bacterium]